MSGLWEDGLFVVVGLLPMAEIWVRKGKDSIRASVYAYEWVGESTHIYRHLLWGKP